MSEYEIGGLKLKNRVMTAAGTVGFGVSYADYYDLDILGALVLRSLTLKPRDGSPMPRIWETASGMMNRVGLQNPGLDKFMSTYYSSLCKLTVPVIASVCGAPYELKELARALNTAEKISAIEVNLYTTYDEYRELGYSGYAKLVEDRVGAACAHFTRPVWVKLMPQAGDIVLTAKVAKSCGASAAVACNSFWSMAVDPSTGKSRLSTRVGSLSGPCIKPISVFNASRVASETGLDVIGAGGIACADDAREYLLVGAKAVAIGSGCFSEPELVKKIIAEIEGEDTSGK
ncbi:MAG: HisA/HisF-related TIM barrel protein [Clostridia bacterium]